MKFIPFGDLYVHKDDVPNYEVVDDEIPPSNPTSPAAQKVGSSSGAGSSFSLEYNILSMNKRIKILFLLSNSRHEEVVGLIRVINTRISNLEYRFDKEFTYSNEDDENDDMSAEFYEECFLFLLYGLLLDC